MPKKKYNKIPRKKKKQLKQQLGITEKITRSQLLELEQKERARQSRVQAQARRYKQNREYLQNLGIPDSIISKSTSKKETQRRAQKYLSQQTDRKTQYTKRYADKVARLINAGYSQKQAQELAGNVWRQKSNKDIDRMISIRRGERIENDNYLYIGFAEKVGGFSKYDLSDLSDEELLDKLNERIVDARMNPDDSHGNKFRGVFQFASVDSKEKAQRRAEYWYQHGYNLNFKHGKMKLDSSRYEKLTISNKYSYREFLEMAYTCADQMLNHQVDEFVDTLKKFDKDNFYTKDFK